jgi:hypothetical protein
VQFFVRLLETYQYRAFSVFGFGSLKQGEISSGSVNSSKAPAEASASRETQKHVSSNDIFENGIEGKLQFVLHYSIYLISNLNL